MPVQTKMIELKSENFWVVVNPNEIKVVNITNCDAPYLDKFNISIAYYGDDEPTMGFKQMFTEDECKKFIAQFNS